MRIPTRRLQVFGSLLHQKSHFFHHPTKMFSMLHSGHTIAGRLHNSPVKTCCYRLQIERYSVHNNLYKERNPRTIQTLNFHSGVYEKSSSLKGSFKKTIFSGIQPTGVLHLGNYFGAVRNWVDLQECGENVIFCVVDLHSITLPQDAKSLYNQIITMAASLLACGIDPSKAILFQQSCVSEHSQLNWVLGCLTTMARLGHLPQFKEKSQSMKEIPLGLYVYPVLQAADILLYKATHVPVGDDQRQHIQLAADLARVFNNKFGPTFILPRSMVYDDTSSRIRSLRNPSKKMSKSEADPKSRIVLTDMPEMIQEKFRKAVTDCTSAIYYDAENRSGVSNIMTIHSLITGKSYDDIAAEFKGVESAKYKLMVADVVIEHLNPIRLRYEELMNDKAYINNILEKGAEKAKEIAHNTWEEVRQKVGLSN